VPWSLLLDRLNRVFLALWLQSRPTATDFAAASCGRSCISEHIGLSIFAHGANDAIPPTGDFEIARWGGSKTNRPTAASFLGEQDVL
jgi:hypothetical protein